MAEMTKLQQWLLKKNSKTFNSYYTGKMSYALHGAEWETYVANALPDLKDEATSENIFKTVLDAYAENLVPTPAELRGFSNTVIPLLSRGEAPVLITADGQAHFPEHYEMVSDGRFTIAAIFTRDLEKMLDYITFAWSDGRTELWYKPIPEDMAVSELTQGFSFVEETTGNTLLRFALDDKGFGASLAALQDRVNHSIIDQTVIAEMYARPFWYLLDVEIAPENPYLPKQPESAQAMKEQKTKAAAGRIFTTNGKGPFGQLTPPTIGDMINYHDSIIAKVTTTTGIPQYFFQPGEGTPPTGVALMVLSKRFNNKVARIRDDIKDQLEELCTAIGVTINEDDFWPQDDDILQQARDQHGINLSQMGYPLEYIAEVVTPGVDLNDYLGEEEGGLPATASGQPTDMTAMGQTGLPATPGQVAAYAASPGQRAKA